MIKAILLDLDNTLCDYDASVDAAFAGATDLAIEAHPGIDGACVRREFDAILEEWTRGNKPILPVTDERAERFFLSLQRCGVSDRPLAQQMAELYGRLRFERLTLFPEAVQALERLRASYLLIIVTNGPSEVQRGEVSVLELERHLDHIIYAGDCEYEKPDPRIFALALERAGCDPSQAVFVGDSPRNDIAGASACGITTIWVNRSARAYPDELPRPDYEVRSLDELEMVLSDRT